MPRKKKLLTVWVRTAAGARSPWHELRVPHLGGWFRAFRHWARRTGVHYTVIDGGTWSTLTSLGIFATHPQGERKALRQLR